MKNLIIIFLVTISAFTASLAQNPSNTESQEPSVKSDSAGSLQLIPNLKNLIGREEKITAQAETEDSWWMGTKNGVYRIKKKNGKVMHYNLQNFSLPSNNITCICARPDGQVYIGTDNGIIHYDLFAFLFITTENSKLLSNNVTALDYLPKKGIAVETDWNNWYLIK